MTKSIYNDIMAISSYKEDGMKQKLNKKTVLICVYGFIIAINILPLIMFSDRVALRIYSIPAAATMAINILHGFMSYLYRYKRNYLVLGNSPRNAMWHMLSDDREASEKELKEFYMMLKIYCAPIPFYIPIIFFAQSFAQSCWCFAVYFAPQIIFLGIGIKYMRDEIKEEKARKEQREKERIEQEKREELGFFK